MAALAAGIGAGGSLLSGVLGGKGASSAAKAQAQASEQATAENARQFNQTQANIMPDVNAGNAATQQLLRALGLGDMYTGTSQNPYTAQQQQEGYLSGVKSSPLYTGAYDTGVDTILQNAAATGGLRGGNVQNSLAQFGSGLFSNVYQNQVSNLQNLSGLGANAATGLGTASQNSSNANSTLLNQTGAAQATGIAGSYGAAQGTANSLSGILQQYLNGNSGGDMGDYAAYGWLG